MHAPLDDDTSAGALSDRRDDTTGATARLPYKTLMDAIVVALRDWILEGTLRPGERLRIREVAARFGTSTMPVREALARLEMSGLVTKAPHKGVVVSRLTAKDLHDFYGTRRVLEPGAALLGAQSMREPTLSRLRDIWAELEQHADRRQIRAVLRLEEDFLGVLYQQSGNDVLVQLIRSIWDRVTPYKLLYTSTSEYHLATGIVLVNKRVLEACEQADGRRAAALVGHSLKEAESHLARLLIASPNAN